MSFTKLTFLKILGRIFCVLILNQLPGWWIMSCGASDLFDYNFPLPPPKKGRDDRRAEDGDRSASMKSRWRSDDETRSDKRRRRRRNQGRVEKSSLIRDQVPSREQLYYSGTKNLLLQGVPPPHGLFFTFLSYNRGLKLQLLCEISWGVNRS